VSPVEPAVTDALAAPLALPPKRGPTGRRSIDIVFDGPPHEGANFVEVERDRKSIRIGE
jgi:hypothetical protein